MFGHLLGVDKFFNYLKKNYNSIIYYFQNIFSTHGHYQSNIINSSTYFHMRKLWFLECQNEDILSLPRLIGHYRREIHYSRRHFHSYYSSEEGVEGKQTEGFKGFICSWTSTLWHNLSKNNRCHKCKASLEHNTRRVLKKWWGTQC